MEKARELSFELHEEMLEAISRDFSPDKIASRLAEAVHGKDEKEAASIGEKIFAEYGIEWGRQVVDLGESYMDRTYEILKESLDQTGNPAFPLVPQRFIEIAYLSTQNISTLPLVENNYKRIIFRIEQCKTYQEISNQCGAETASSMTCQHGCLNLCKTIMGRLEIPGVSAEHSTKTSDKGYCEFHLSKKSSN